MLGTLLMLSKEQEIRKGSGQIIKNSRNVDRYFTANPKTKSRLRQSLPRQWSTASRC